LHRGVRDGVMHRNTVARKISPCGTGSCTATRLPARSRASPRGSRRWAERTPNRPLRNSGPRPFPISNLRRARAGRADGPGRKNLSRQRRPSCRGPILLPRGKQSLAATLVVRPRMASATKKTRRSLFLPLARTRGRGYIVRSSQGWLT
jgi:hypothetical protein